ncbi:hypothetical protein BC629DRAFT_1597361 [Irpex lacteus]|nr:hypothetical protein BC629DRAFT_1443538 [Irpex lacteus]KAI0761219.1 hypothetical protein BC629DRAFT_1597361 [Irpex lacteus]
MSLSSNISPTLAALREASSRMFQTPDEFLPFDATGTPAVEQENQDGAEPITSSLGKHPRTSDGNGTDDENSDNDIQHSASNTAQTGLSASLPAAIPQINMNNIEAARRIGRKKRLDESNMRRLEEFTKKPNNIQTLSVFGELLALNTNISQILVTQASWKPSRNLEKNMKVAAATLLLSPNIASYKGNEVAVELVEYLRTHWGTELPPNLDNNYANYQAVLTEAREALTQCRAMIKKELRSSLVPTVPTQKWNIFTLTKKVTKMTNVEPSIKLCARLALMRTVYVTEGHNALGEKYWDIVDNALDEIRVLAKGDKAHENRLLVNVLNVDRATYGVRSSYEIPAE